MHQSGTRPCSPRGVQAVCPCVRQSSVPQRAERPSASEPVAPGASAARSRTGTRGCEREEENTDPEKQKHKRKKGTGRSRRVERGTQTGGSPVLPPLRELQSLLRRKAAQVHKPHSEPGEPVFKSDSCKSVKKLMKPFLPSTWKVQAGEPEHWWAQPGPARVSGKEAGGASETGWL